MSLVLIPLIDEFAALDHSSLADCAQGNGGLTGALSLADWRHRRAFPSHLFGGGTFPGELGQDATGEAFVATIDPRFALDAHQVVFAQELLVYADVDVVPGEDFVQIALAEVVEVRINAGFLANARSHLLCWC